MKELNQHKFKFNPYLEDLYQSDKPLIIYKVDNGYNIYTDFSKKIVLTKKNIHNFLNSLEKKKYKKETDLYLGFFGYEILCNLIGINLKNKKRINFYKGIFYKPETIIKIRKDIKVISNIKKHTFNYQFNKTQILSPFKVNISYAKYKKIFELFQVFGSKPTRSTSKVCSTWIGTVPSCVQTCKEKIGTFAFTFINCFPFKKETIIVIAITYELKG